MKIDWEDGVRPALIFLFILVLIAIAIPGCVEDYRRASRMSGTPDGFN